MARHDAAHWDERYAVDARLWTSGPSALVVDVLSALGPGAGRRAVDLGAGEGRHAVWLAQHGWRVTAVDFSAVAVGRGREHSASAGVDVTWVVADVDDWQPPEPVDLALLAWLRLEDEPFAATAAALAPGGHLVVTGHGRPRAGARASRFRQDPSLLRRQAEQAGLTVERSEECERAPETGAGPAGDPGTDVLLVARRQTGGDGRKARGAVRPLG